MPAYHQGAEIEAFHQAGLRLLYYDTDELLKPDPEQLESLLGPDVRALHVIHYWGFPQDMFLWRAWCDSRDLFLIEDGAQALLASSGGQPVGSIGDLAVFCLYKSFGLPDGAAAICRSELPMPRSTAPIGIGRFARRLGSALAHRNGILAALHRRFGGSDPTTRSFGEFVKGEFELGDPLEPPSRLTGWALNRVVTGAAREQRRDNYRYLIERIGHKMPKALRTLTAGAVPIAFPVQTETPELLMATLNSEGIDTGRLWPTWHPSLETEAFPIARMFRETVVAVPVHQELLAADLDRIAGGVQRAGV